jgi:hypothetical protein
MRQTLRNMKNQERGTRINDRFYSDDVEDGSVTKDMYQRARCLKLLVFTLVFGGNIVLILAVVSGSYRRTGWSLRSR